MHARRALARGGSKRPAARAGGGAWAVRGRRVGGARAARGRRAGGARAVRGRRAGGLERPRAGPAAARARQARASERRFISSCVISRCSVFSALPGSDM